MLNSTEDATKERQEPIKIKTSQEDLSRSSSPNVGTYPMSVRQQLAMIKQMEMPSPSGSTDSERPSTPSRKTKISKIHKKNNRGETPLHVLARRGDATHCLEVIQQGAEVNVADYAGWTPLHEACSHRAFETAKILIEHGADVNKASLDGETPLHDSVANKDIKITWLLLRHGADRLIGNRQSKQPIDLCKDEAIATLLMSSTVPEECPQSQNQSRQASEEPSQAAPPPPTPATPPPPPESAALMPPTHEASSPAPEQIDYGDDGDRVAIVTISTETEPLEPVVEAAEEEPVPTHGDPMTIQPAQEQPAEYVQVPMVATSATAPPPFPGVKAVQVIELELSEESASSSRNSPAQQNNHTSPSASPEQQHDQPEDYPPTSSYSYQEDVEEKEAKKTPRGIRGRSARPNSGTATPVTSGKKTRGRGRKGRGGARIAELAAEAIHQGTEDVYTFRATPDSEVDPYDREASMGPLSKKARFEGDEMAREEYDQEEEDDHSRNNPNSSKKVPKLRILLPVKQPSEEEAEQTPPAYAKTKNLGIRGKMGKRGADNEEQRITRSKSDKMRQNAKHLEDDGDNLSIKKKRTRITLTPLPEEPPETSITIRPIERQITPIPDTLTEGQKILYMPPHKGIYQLKKRIEARWEEDCKKDSENLKKSTERFSKLLIYSNEERSNAITVRNGEYDDFPQNLPPDMQNDLKVSELLTAQYQERKELFHKMKIEKTRLQMTYEQEYVRMIKRREGTAPLMSFTRIHREEEVLNPLFVDAPPHRAPQIDEASFYAKIDKKTHQMFTEHKMDCNILYTNQREQWRSFFRKKMIVTVEPVPYAGIVLHALKYPSKGVFGLLIGSKDAKGVKITSVVPVTHETHPLAPILEIALGLTSSSNSINGNIVGAYFANPNYQDKSLSVYATRLAERIGSVNNSQPLLVQVINWQLNPDCPSNCLGAYVKDGDSWKDLQLHADSACLRITSRAIEQKFHRNIVDLDNHLDKPDLDFFNAELNGQLKEISGL